MVADFRCEAGQYVDAWHAELVQRARIGAHADRQTQTVRFISDEDALFI